MRQIIVKSKIDYEKIMYESLNLFNITFMRMKKKNYLKTFLIYRNVYFTLKIEKDTKVKPA